MSPISNNSSQGKWERINNSTSSHNPSNNQPSNRAIFVLVIEKQSSKIQQAMQDNWVRQLQLANAKVPTLNYRLDRRNNSKLRRVRMYKIALRSWSYLRDTHHPRKQSVLLHRIFILLLDCGCWENENFWGSVGWDWLVQGIMKAHPVLSPLENDKQPLIENTSTDDGSLSSLVFDWIQAKVLLE